MSFKSLPPNPTGGFTKIHWIHNEKEHERTPIPSVQKHRRVALHTLALMSQSLPKFLATSPAAVPPVVRRVVDSAPSEGSARTVQAPPRWAFDVILVVTLRRVVGVL